MAGSRRGLVGHKSRGIGMPSVQHIEVRARANAQRPGCGHGARPDLCLGQESQDVPATAVLK